jgi:D-glycero-D-manno-heptose 1,7-bisphosphate phosphatase
MSDKTDRSAVFLDRDGVLNHAIFRHGRPHSPQNLIELVIVDGARSALEILKREGFILIVVTNQPDLARTSRADVEKINHRLGQSLPLDAIIVCEHDDKDHANAASRSQE